MKPDAEHQQHHADFGELLKHPLIDGRQSRKEADGQTCANVADKRRRF